VEIKLLVEDKEKTFVVPFVKGRMFRRVLEIFKDYDLDNMTPETLDVLVDFIVECFNVQFSRDDFYDGIAVEKIRETILKFIYKIAGIEVKDKDPNLEKN
jgi:hypothetical protein